MRATERGRLWLCLLLGWMMNSAYLMLDKDYHGLLPQWVAVPLLFLFASWAWSIFNDAVPPHDEDADES